MSDILTINTEENVVKEHKPLTIYNEHNPLLKTKLAPFDFANLPVNPHMIEKELLMTMKHFGGIGLAANQVGWNYRMFVLEGGLSCFNPKIVQASDITNHDREGCLSFPGLWLRIHRPERICVEYYNADGQLQQQEFTGMTARCFQHELDHLNGVVFTSLVGNLTLQMARKKQQKLFKKIERIRQYKQS
jgi:peptide deformylase